MILGTEPAAARLAGQSLVAGQQFTKLFPAARYWSSGDPATGRLPAGPPRPFTLAGTQFMAHLEAQGDTLCMRLWEIDTRPAHLPARLLAAQHALAAATTVEEVTGALVTGLSTAGVARAELYLPDPLAQVPTGQVSPATVPAPPEAVPSIAVNAGHPAAQAFRAGRPTVLPSP